MITEHAVDMPLAGKPRWWTVTNENGAREVVRVECDRATYFPNATPDMFPAELFPRGMPPDVVVFVLLKPGQFKWPPLAAASLRLGRAGLDRLVEGGARLVVEWERSDLWRKLELMLAGWKR